MTYDTEFKTFLEEHCTTAEIFEQLLSILLVTAHDQGIDVMGAWEAHENGSAPEWDIVVTPLARDDADTTEPGE